VTIEIRPLNVDTLSGNIDAFLAIDQKVFGAGAWAAENFLADMPMKWDFSSFAVANDNIIGFLIASSPASGLAHLNRIAVSRQALGLGARLVEDLETRCVAHDQRAISLEFENQLGVGGFYIRCGYADADEHERQAYLMMKGKSEATEIVPGDNEYRRIMVKPLADNVDVVSLMMANRN
jgi:hypothetical protein